MSWCRRPSGEREVDNATATLAVVIRCPSCGAENAEQARFCSTCGHSLVARVAVEQRRHVTALFADLAASTAMGERLDPEVVRGIVGRFFERASEEIRARGGSVEKFAGDAVLALFGLQAAHEDDPERAVRAALAIRDALDEIAADTLSSHGIEMGLRIGIEAGEVVVGDPFGGATMATGDPLNVAARLEQGAQRGEIVVGPVVHGGTSRAFRFESAGEWDLSGKADATPAWRVIEPIAEIGAARGIEGLSAPLTGRDEEMALLLDAARRTRTERKAILFTVLGVPGVGKSRLVREVATTLANDGTRVLRGRCLPYGDGITYWPVGEILRDLADIGPELDARAAVERLRWVAPDDAVADRLAFAIGLVSEAPVSGEAINDEITWAVRRMVESHAAQQPLLLIVEDIHWAEPPLLDMLEHLATWLREVPVLIACLARPDLLDTRPAWGAGRMEASRISLEPLTRDEATALIGELLHVEGLPVGLRERILDRAEGNPLFVEETIRMLIDRGAITHRDGRWVAGAGIEEVGVPDSIEALIRSRLDALPREELAVLQAGSVIGRVFERDAVAGLTDKPAERHLDDAVLRDLLTMERSAPASYRFKHILIRDVAYAALPKARRAELHLAVIDWLSASAGDRRDEIVEIEAFHLEQAASLQRELLGVSDADVRDRAVSALAASARKALARHDFSAAEGFAERALAIGPADESATAELEALLVESLATRGELGKARPIADRLQKTAARLGRRDLRGQALVAIGMDSWIGPGRAARAQDAVEILKEARAELELAGDLVHLSDVDGNLAWEGWWYGDIELAIRRWENAASLAHQIGDAGREATALLRVVGAATNIGDVERATATFDRISLISAGTSRLVQARIWHEAGRRLYFFGQDAPEGIRLWENALEVLTEAGAHEDVEGVLDSLGWAAQLDGDLARARGYFERQASLLEGISHGGRLPEAYRSLAEVALARGDIGGAEEHALRAREIVEPDDWATVASTAATLGRVRAAQARDEEAEALLREGVAIIERTQFRIGAIELYQALAEFLLARGREEGEHWYEMARDAGDGILGESSPIVTQIERVVAAAREQAG
jgi:class 3 adenylate cyclase/tetratricopeptide (TPR) repeat protein